MAETVKISGELESVATGNKVADVANIKDKTQGNKSQAAINAELETALEERYTKSETYNKTQLDNMITTPEIAYKDYDTYADMLAETNHPAGAIYRVANYDGTQAVTNKYAEYSWDGTQYKLMAVRDHGIDDVPTARSNNLVASGGVEERINEGILLSEVLLNPANTLQNFYYTVSGERIGAVSLSGNNAKAYNVSEFVGKSIHVESVAISTFSTYKVAILFGDASMNPVSDPIFYDSLNLDTVTEVPSQAVNMYINYASSGSCDTHSFSEYDIREEVEKVRTDCIATDKENQINGNLIDIVTLDGMVTTGKFVSVGSGTVQQFVDASSSFEKYNVSSYIGNKIRIKSTLNISESLLCVFATSANASIETVAKTSASMDVEVTVPENATYLYLNVASGSTCFAKIYKNYDIREHIEEVYDDVFPFTALDTVNGSYISSSTTEGVEYVNVFPNIPNSKYAFYLLDDNVKAVKIDTKPVNAEYSAICFIADKNNKVLAKKTVSDFINKETIIIPNGAHSIYINGNIDYTISLCDVIDMAIVESLQNDVYDCVSLPAHDSGYVSYTGSGDNKQVQVFNSGFPDSKYIAYTIEDWVKEVKIATIAPSNVLTMIYVIVDVNNRILDYAVNADFVNLKTIVLPENSYKLYVNGNINYNIRLCKNPKISKTFKSLVGHYNVQDNPVVLPPALYLRSDKDVPLFKNSLFTKYLRYKDCDILLQTNSAKKFLEISEPAYLSYNSLGNTGKFLIGRQDKLDKLVYKDVAIYKKDISGLNGKSVSILSFGDSLTEGLDWTNTPICMLIDELTTIGVTTTTIGTLARNYTNKQGQTVKINYEGHGGWSYRAAVGMRANYMHLPDSYTKHEWVEGVDGAMADIKQNNAFLYEATAEDKTNHPEWCFHIDDSGENFKSYADDSSLGTYWIFSPSRYFSERNIDIPDIITIAFGTNEWYLESGKEYDIDISTACCKWMVSAFAEACPNTKIVVVPSNNVPTTRENQWERYIMPLCSNVIKEISALNNSNVFICPIYAQGSRILAYNGTVGTATNISGINDVKEIGIDNNVHVLYIDDDSNDDYAESLAACVVNLIE